MKARTWKEVKKEGRRNVGKAEYGVFGKGHSKVKGRTRWRDESVSLGKNRR